MTGSGGFRRAFGCFGGTVSIQASGDGAEAAIARGEVLAREIHTTLTRFDSDSELCRLNEDPRSQVGASPLLCRLAATIRWAGEASDGLVDATCLPALEEAGYRDSLDSGPEVSPSLGAGSTRPALADPRERWREIEVDWSSGTIHRPPGLRLDSGGLAKGMAADLIAGLLDGLETFAVDCAGDVRVGGRLGAPQPIVVGGPGVGDPPVGVFVLRDGAAATSGISRRRWRGHDGEVAHHLIDPGRGIPAQTGVVQATAIAATVTQAEVRAKTALLSGPGDGEKALPAGGLLVLDGGATVRVPGRAAVMAAAAR